MVNERLQQMNIVNPYDLLEVFQEVIGRGPGWLLRRLKISNAERVTAAWGDKAEFRLWPDILIRHTNKKISGDENTGPEAYFAKKYLSGKDSVTALSIGCGEGTHELEWARTGTITKLDGFDLSKQRIELARKRAIAAGLDGLLNFEVRDILKVDEKDQKYDLVIAIASLHHFSPLEISVVRISDYLKPGGLLYVNEYVGPRRWQWTSGQIAGANRMLKKIPRAYRKRKNGFYTNRVWKPGLLRMYFSDPSEAVESDRIIPLLDKYFERVEFKPLGGAITQLIFGKIAHNFKNADSKSDEIIKMVIDEEELLSKERQIESDFLFAVYRKPLTEGLQRTQ